MSIHRTAGKCLDFHHPAGKWRHQGTQAKATPKQGQGILKSTSSPGFAPCVCLFFVSANCCFFLCASTDPTFPCALLRVSSLSAMLCLCPLPPISLFTLSRVDVPRRALGTRRAYLQMPCRALFTHKHRSRARRGAERTGHTGD